jgi:hypothetical protein
VEYTQKDIFNMSEDKVLDLLRSFGFKGFSPYRTTFHWQRRLISEMKKAGKIKMKFYELDDIIEFETWDSYSGNGKQDINIIYKLKGKYEIFTTAFCFYSDSGWQPMGDVFDAISIHIPFDEPEYLPNEYLCCDEIRYIVAQLMKHSKVRLHFLF